MILAEVAGLGSGVLGGQPAGDDAALLLAGGEPLDEERVASGDDGAELLRSYAEEPLKCLSMPA